MMGIRDKYICLQSRLKSAGVELAKFGDYGCLFLCVCSIADEFNHSFYTGREVDIVKAYLDCFDKGWIGLNFYCKNQEAMLKHLTGFEWTKEVVEKLPEQLGEMTYTVEKWVNPKTGANHFKRRWGDTLRCSIANNGGTFQGYYMYTAHS